LIKKFYNYYISPEKQLTRKVKSVVGITPSNLMLYKLAFCHKSLNNGDSNTKYNNERLEYLGDSILNTIVAEYLFKKYPAKDEGFLTKMRSKIVKRKTLNSMAQDMGLDIILSSYSIGKMSNSMLGNALEALVGAIYLESGYDKTSRYVIDKMLRKYLDMNQLEMFDDNYKSQLLEHCQKSGRKVEFKLLSKYKLDKRDRFKVSVNIDGRSISTAEDFNKKAAEQMASNRALKEIVFHTP